MHQGSCHWQYAGIGKAAEPIHRALGRQGFILCHRFPHDVTQSAARAGSCSGQSGLTGSYAPPVGRNQG
jgi:hypothetical protein